VVFYNRKVTNRSCDLDQRPDSRGFSTPLRRAGEKRGDCPPVLLEILAEIFSKLSLFHVNDGRENEHRQNERPENERITGDDEIPHSEKREHHVPRVANRPENAVSYEPPPTVRADLTKREKGAYRDRRVRPIREPRGDCDGGNAQPRDPRGPWPGLPPPHFVETDDCGDHRDVERQVDGKGGGSESLPQSVKNVDPRHVDRDGEVENEEERPEKLRERASQAWKGHPNTS
jgi:hypothetical protein